MKGVRRDASNSDHVAPELSTAMKSFDTLMDSKMARYLVRVHMRWSA